MKRGWMVVGVDIVFEKVLILGMIEEENSIDARSIGMERAKAEDPLHIMEIEAFELRPDFRKGLCDFREWLITLGVRGKSLKCVLLQLGEVFTTFKTEGESLQGE